MGIVTQDTAPRLLWQGSTHRVVRVWNDTDYEWFTVVERRDGFDFMGTPRWSYVDSLPADVLGIMLCELARVHGGCGVPALSVAS